MAIACVTDIYHLYLAIFQYASSVHIINCLQLVGMTKGALWFVVTLNWLGGGPVRYCRLK